MSPANEQCLPKQPGQGSRAWRAGRGARLTCWSFWRLRRSDANCLNRKSRRNRWWAFGAIPGRIVAIDALPRSVTKRSCCFCCFCSSWSIFPDPSAAVVAAAAAAMAGPTALPQPVTFRSAFPLGGPQTWVAISLVACTTILHLTPAIFRLRSDTCRGARARRPKPRLAGGRQPARMDAAPYGLHFGAVQCGTVILRKSASLSILTSHK